MFRRGRLCYNRAARPATLVCEDRTSILRHDHEALDIDVTRCRFAESFRALGEPELGALLICEADFDIVSVGEGEVSLERAQTIMQGAPSCTFRYKFAPR
jgi:hypothetical protein